MVSFGTALRPQPRCYLKAIPDPCSLTTAPYSVAYTAYTACMLQRGSRYGGRLHLASHIKTEGRRLRLLISPIFHLFHRSTIIDTPSQDPRPSRPFRSVLVPPAPAAYLYITRQPWSVSIIRAPGREPRTRDHSKLWPTHHI